MFTKGKMHLSEMGNDVFLPNFCDGYTILSGIILTELLAFILAFMSFNQTTDHLLSELMIISLFIQSINLSSLGLLCFMCRWLRPLNSNFIAGLLCYCIILMTTAVISELAWWLDTTASTSTFVLTNLLIVALLGALMLYFYQIIFDKRRDLAFLSYVNGLMLIFFLSESIAFFMLSGAKNEQAMQQQLFLLRNLSISAIISAIVLRYLYIQYQWRQEVQITANARWQALQTRIRPHFLFNSLNTIASLTRLNPTKAEQAVEDLAALFRASLSDAQQTTLADELKLCQQYLRFESLRFGERLKVIWNIENLPTAVLFPPLMLQPLLENALHHGIYSRSEGGILRITGLTDKRQIRIEVESPKAQQASPQGFQIAQQNIQQRLQTYFGTQAKLTVYEQMDTYCVILAFPYKNTLKS